jgi:hypothetical protein
VPARRLLAVSVVAAALLTGPGAASAQRIANGRVEPAAVTGPLAREIAALASRTSDPFWIGYAMPVVAGDRVMCCVSSGRGSDGVVFSSGRDAECTGCSLEPGDGGPKAAAQTAAGPVHLEGATEFLVLARVSGGTVEKIRTFSADCPLDAGGRTVHWLTGVTPAASLAWLADFTRDGDTRAGSAIGAIALTAGPDADQALDRLIATGQPDRIREQAAFWLGEARGRHGFDTLRRLLATDPSDDVRRRAVFGLSRSDQPETIGALITLARSDRSPRVRGEALFWLAHKAREKAIGPITDAIANDPDTAVKKRAVFALSQLPKDEGVPRLIEVARTNRNPEVRKQAMFWLGQSKDPRALAFFEKILGK